MEEEVKEKKEKKELKAFTIVEPDFILKPVNEAGYFFDLTFMKRVKKRDTGKIEVEPGETRYGVPIFHAFNAIACHKTLKKFGERNITLKEYLVEFDKIYREIAKMVHEYLMLGDAPLDKYSKQLKQYGCPQ